MRGRITRRSVEALKPAADGAEAVLWDSELKGFGVRVQKGGGNPYVIAGAKPCAALVNLEKPWRAIRKPAGLDDVRLHDLRHAFASVAASSGMGLPIIGKMLGHSQPATTARYAHLASDPVKAAATAVANKIAAAMGAGGCDAGQSGGTVLPLRRDA